MLAPERRTPCSSGPQLAGNKQQAPAGLRSVHHGVPQRTEAPASPADTGQVLFTACGVQLSSDSSWLYTDAVCREWEQAYEQMAMDRGFCSIGSGQERQVCNLRLHTRPHVSPQAVLRLTIA